MGSRGQSKWSATYSCPFHAISFGRAGSLRSDATASPTAADFSGHSTSTPLLFPKPRQALNPSSLLEMSCNRGADKHRHARLSELRKVG